MTKFDSFTPWKIGDGNVSKRGGVGGGGCYYKNGFIRVFSQRIETGFRFRLSPISKRPVSVKWADKNRLYPVLFKGVSRPGTLSTLKTVLPPYVERDDLFSRVKGERSGALWINDGHLEGG